MVSVTFVFGSVRSGLPVVRDKDTVAPQIALASHINQGSAESLSDTASGPEEDSLVKAAIYGVYSLNGERLAGLNENKRWPIASLTKLMTAVVARSVIPTSDKIKISEEIFKIEDIGASGGFSAGEIFAPRDLEKALLIVSSNAAAEAIATHYGRQKFIDTMNSTAYKLGMFNTYFADPTGLSYKDQSTADDLTKLVTHILTKYPDMLKTTRIKTDRIYDFKSGKRRTISNINEFAGQPYFIGGKTGTTPEAVGNLISVFSRDNGYSGRIVALLGSEDRYNETKGLLENWK